MLKKILNKIFKKVYQSGYEEGKASTAFARDQLTGAYEMRIKAMQAEMEKSRMDYLSLWMVDPNYVFSVTKTGIILLNGVQITNQELKNLKSEIHALKEFEIYKVLQNTLRQKAIEKSVLFSTDLYTQKGNEQVLAGKMMIFSLDIIRTIINDIDRSKLIAR